MLAGKGIGRGIIWEGGFSKVVVIHSLAEVSALAGGGTLAVQAEITLFTGITREQSSKISPGYIDWWTVILKEITEENKKGW